MEDSNVVLSQIFSTLSELQSTQQYTPQKNRGSRSNPKLQDLDTYKNPEWVAVTFNTELHAFVREFADELQVAIDQGYFEVRPPLTTERPKKPELDARETDPEKILNAYREGMDAANVIRLPNDWYETICNDPASPILPEVVNAVSRPYNEAKRLQKNLEIALGSRSFTADQTATLEGYISDIKESIDPDSDTADKSLLKSRELSIQEDLSFYKLTIMGLVIADSIPQLPESLYRTSTLAKIVIAIVGTDVRDYQSKYFLTTFDKLIKRQQTDILAAISICRAVTDWEKLSSKLEDLGGSELPEYLASLESQQIQTYASFFQSRVGRPMGFAKDVYLPLLSLLHLSYVYGSADDEQRSRYASSVTEKIEALSEEPNALEFQNAVAFDGICTLRDVQTFYGQAQVNEEAYSGVWIQKISLFAQEFEIPTTKAADDTLFGRRDADGGPLFLRPNSINQQKEISQYSWFERMLCFSGLTAKLTEFQELNNVANEVNKRAQGWIKRADSETTIRKDIGKKEAVISSSTSSQAARTQARQDIEKLNGNLKALEPSQYLIDTFNRIEAFRSADDVFSQMSALNNYVLIQDTKFTHYFDWCVHLFKSIDPVRYKSSGLATSMAQVRLAIDRLREPRNIEAKKELFKQSLVYTYKTENGYRFETLDPNRKYEYPKASSSWSAALTIENIVQKADVNDRETIRNGLRSAFKDSTLKASAPETVMFLGAVACPNVKDLSAYKFTKIDIANAKFQVPELSGADMYKSPAFNPLTLFTGASILSSCCMQPIGAGATATMVDYLIDDFSMNDERNPKIRPFYTVWVFAKPTKYADGRVAKSTCLPGTFFSFSVGVTANITNNDIVQEWLKNESATITYGESALYLSIKDPKRSVLYPSLNRGQSFSGSLGTHDGWEHSRSSSFSDAYVLNAGRKLSCLAVESSPDFRDNIFLGLAKNFSEAGLADTVYGLDFDFQNTFGLKMAVDVDYNAAYCDMGVGNYGGVGSFLKTVFGEFVVSSADAFFSKLHMVIQSDCSAQFIYEKRTGGEVSVGLTPEQFRYATSFPCGASYLPFKGTICVEFPDHDMNDSIALTQEIFAPQWFDSANAKKLVIGGLSYDRKGLVALRQPKALYVIDGSGAESAPLKLR